MTIEETFNFNPTNFDSDGFHKSKPDFIFLSSIRESEENFYLKHKPLYANMFSANSKTMRLLQSSFNGDANDIHGMESADGEVDIEINLEIEAHSESNTIYAIDSLAGDDEPLFLVINDDCSDKEFVLKYMSDDENDDDLEDVPNPKSKVKDSIPAK